MDLGEKTTSVSPSWLQKSYLKQSLFWLPQAFFLLIIHVFNVWSLLSQGCILGSGTAFFGCWTPLCFMGYKHSGKAYQITNTDRWKKRGRHGNFRKCVYGNNLTIWTEFPFSLVHWGRESRIHWSYPFTMTPTSTNIHTHNTHKSSFTLTPDFPKVLNKAWIN